MLELSPRIAWALWYHRGMQVETVPLTDIQVHPRNPRRGNIEAIAESIQVNDVYKPLIVQRSTGYVLAGNHTYLALCKLGWMDAQVIYLDVDDERAHRILVVDNRSFEKGGGWEEDLLTELLSEMDDPYLGTGWTPDELDDMLAGIAADPEAPPAMGLSLPIYSTPAGQPNPYAVSDQAILSERERWRDAQPVSAFGIREKILKYPQDEWVEITRYLGVVMQAGHYENESQAALRGVKCAAAAAFCASDPDTCSCAWHMSR